MVSLEYYQDAVDMIATGPKPEELISFKPSAKMQLRVRELLDKEKADTITPEEKKELDNFLFFDHIMRLIKSRALTHIATK